LVKNQERNWYNGKPNLTKRPGGCGRREESLETNPGGMLESKGVKKWGERETQEGRVL